LRVSRARLVVGAALALGVGCSSSLVPLTVSDDGGTFVPSDAAIAPAMDAPPTSESDAPVAAASDAGLDVVLRPADAPPVAPDAGGVIDRPTPPGGCIPTVATGQENTDALCANGLDDDCNGYADCRDFRCSRLTPAVTVCRVDAGSPGVDVPPAMDVLRPPTDVPTPMDLPVHAGLVGPTGGTVSRMRFGVFGDVRPPSENNTAMYPTAIVTAVMDGIAGAGAQFAVANGDYMFANTASAVGAQVGLLLSAEDHFGGHIFHSLGNHECNGASASNCPLGNETPNMQAFRARLAPAYPTVYFDWTVRTDLGDAHFIAAAPNAWDGAQQAWLDRALAQPARYTIVIAHEPAGRRDAPGSVLIESAIRARAGGVTLRLYGHTHEYQHQSANAIIVGNAGAPLASATGHYGFVVVDQRADGNLVVTAYEIGRPPMVVDTFAVTPAGTLTH
jgi:hypothetical protein